PLLDIQFLNFSGMLSQESSASLGVFIFHEFSNQLRSQDTIFHRHSLKCTTGWIKHRIAQFFGIHFTQTLEAFKLQSLGLRMRLHELVTRLIIQQPHYFSPVLNRIEWRTGNKHMSILDQIAKFLVKKSQ